MKHFSSAKLYSILSFMLLLLFSAEATAQNYDPDAKLPMDPNIRTGTLPNGMKYFIKKNKEPENRAELRLAVNVGSTMEDENQRGLAHFVEHMAFNGTENFKKSELVDYLESIGTKFGAHLNAYTSFDETVYMLRIPTDDKAIMDKGFQILEDWAHLVAFEEEEIDKERGVVIEEWRLGQGADSRMRDKYFPVLFYGSLYAERLPIGKKEILENFDYKTLIRFYKDWYRPDLMSVIAVGDFDVDEVEKMIKEKFSDIPNPKKPRQKTDIDVPAHEDIKVAVVTDKEAPMTMVQIFHKLPRQPYVTQKDARQYLLGELYTGMLSQRLSELTRTAEPPFIFAAAFAGNFLRNAGVYGSIAAVNQNPQKGLETLLIENERVKLHGFTESELERQKKTFMKQMEKMLNEKETTASADLAGEYVNAFLNSEAIPGIENEYQLFKMLIDQVTLKDVNALSGKFLEDKNTVIIITAPEKEGIVVPTNEEVLALTKKVKGMKVEAYKDLASDEPLISKLPEPGKIAQTSEVKSLGITEWKLENGARVILKPTDFTKAEVLMSAFSPGGSSRFGNSEFVSGRFADDIIDQSGIGSFDLNTLEKKLSDKVVGIGPYIDELFEGFNGSTTNEDMETMFQLLYLYFTKPRVDQEAFQAWKSKNITMLNSMKASPEQVFRDSISAILYAHHPRKMPLTEKDINAVDLTQAYMSYMDRFQDPSDFTFVFVGDFTPEQIKPLVERYIGGIAGMQRQETFKDRGIHVADGKVEAEVKKGVEPKSYVAITFSGDMNWSAQDRLNGLALMKVLSIRLRESLREEKGGTYGVGANFMPAKYPDPNYKVQIFFGCAPENVDELVSTTFNVIEEVKKKGASDKNLQKTKETFKRERETDLKDNNWWKSALTQYYQNEEDPMTIEQFNTMVDKLSSADIQKAAMMYLNTNEYVKVVLKPENQ